MVTTEALLFGDRPSKSVSLVATYAAITMTALVGAAFAGTVSPGAPVTTLLRQDLLSVVLFAAPGLIALGGGYARFGAPACLSVGVVPGASVAVLTAAVGVLDVLAGGTPGVTLGFAFAGSVAYIGLLRAFLGYCAGVTVALLVDARRTAMEPDRESDA
ncbi:hypothetical protein GCM10027435_08990 [Haloparvum alkalitolerans]|uniref:hypothetical protein n=1 Tax=Haloparvum alkalitolerans TaxID=1042953 RepID=UPI003CF172AB